MHVQLILWRVRAPVSTPCTATITKHFVYLPQDIPRFSACSSLLQQLFLKSITVRARLLNLHTNAWSKKGLKPDRLLFFFCYYSREGGCIMIWPWTRCWHDDVMRVVLAGELDDCVEASRRVVVLCGCQHVPLTGKLHKQTQWFWEEVKVFEQKYSQNW